MNLFCHLSKRFFVCQILLLSLVVVLNAQVNLAFSHSSGVYTKPVVLQITSDVPDVEIRYTTDGAIPGADDLLYNRIFILKQLNGTKTNVSQIPTTPLLDHLYYKWIPSTSKKPLANIIRARAFQDGQAVSDVVTGFYLVTGSDFIDADIPIVSIVTDSVHFFGHETGIYVPGLKYEQNWNVHNGNYYGSGDEWERPAHFTYIDETGEVQVNQHIDVRIHGGYTRRFPVKTLRLYAKNSYEYGTFNFPFFDDNPATKYKRLLLRNSGQDFNKTYLADGLMAHIAGVSDMEKQSHKPVLVYINGEYWGVHNLRERIDKYFLKNYHNLHVDRIDVIKFDNQFELEEGDWNAFDHFWDLVTHEDFTEPEAYEAFKETVDIENLIDHYAFKIFFGVHDWGSTNIRIWRPKVTGGKFRWVFFDNDGGFMDPTFDGFAHALAEDGPDWPNPEWATRMFRNLINNIEFRTAFLQRMAYLLNNHFCEDILMAVVDSFEMMYETYMPEHIKRWSYPNSMNSWRSNLNTMRNFALHRHVEVRHQMIQHFAYRFKNTCLPEESDDEATIIQGWIYPNPAVNEFSIYAQVTNDSPVEISLYDVNGRLIEFYPEVFPEDRSVSLQFGKVPTGVYIVRMIQLDKVFVKKLLVKD